MDNSIMAINAYRGGSMRNWLFDDERKGLIGEAFIMGAEKIIDYAISKLGVDPTNIRNVTLIFSDKPFPGFQVSAKATRPEHGGSWYLLEDNGISIEGWLCPATLKFFPQFPESIYLRVEL